MFDFIVEFNSRNASNSMNDRNSRDISNRRNTSNSRNSSNRRNTNSRNARNSRQAGNSVIFRNEKDASKSKDTCKRKGIRDTSSRGGARSSRERHELLSVSKKNYNKKTKHGEVFLKRTKTSKNFVAIGPAKLSQRDVYLIIRGSQRDVVCRG
jgi:hypothetical protein